MAEFFTHSPVHYHFACHFGDLLQVVLGPACGGVENQFFCGAPAHNNSKAVDKVFFVVKKFLYDKEYLLDRLAVIMGGRAAEELTFGTSTSGAQNDLQQVSKMARKMVMDWGMSEKFGHMSFGVNQEEVFLGRDISKQKEFSDATAREIDEEVQKISREAYDRAMATLTKHKAILDKIAGLLIEKEEISGEMVMNLLNHQSEKKK
jgi:cell division protease FtsH